MTKEAKTLETVKKTPLDFLTLSPLNQLIALCHNSGLSADSFLHILQLMDCVTAAIEKRHDHTKKLMQSYGIEKPEVDMTIHGPRTRWNYSKHEKQKEIEEKLEAINNTSHPIGPVNFMATEEFQRFTSKENTKEPLSFSEVALLAKYLLKKSS